MKHGSRFEMVCANCAGVGVSYDFAEGGSPAAIITCSTCGAARGTLGELQAMANSSRSDFPRRDPADRRRSERARP